MRKLLGLGDVVVGVAKEFLDRSWRVCTGSRG